MFTTGNKKAMIMVASRGLSKNAENKYLQHWNDEMMASFQNQTSIGTYAKAKTEMGNIRNMINTGMVVEEAGSS